ncbi:MAG: hypothetical protein AMJ78_05850 [Omnitrophica WOR_2 bacterium SM23_29]|nr:MAG: hypothetical protein AMJ78_05850 [Omnitrophica WOR_2 bacterium SM23_29]
MNKIYKIITLILLAAWLLLIIRTFLVSPSKKVVPTLQLNGENATPSEETPEEVEDDDTKIYAMLVERLKSPFDMSRYQGLLTRNIFVKPEKIVTIFTPENLKLVSVELVTLPFIYIGYIQTQDGGLIGQVNWGPKTHFVIKGEKFKDYKVIEVQKTRLIAEGKEGKLILEFKKPTKGTEFLARLYNEMDDKVYEVRKGEDINSYKILDITLDSVIIWAQNKEWVIKKGR